MLTPHLLIWLVSASPPPLVTRLSIPLPLAGGWRHRSPGRSCLWRPRPLSPASISSALASERNIYCSAPPCVCVPCSDIWRIYVGILRPIAPPPSRSWSWGALHNKMSQNMSLASVPIWPEHSEFATLSSGFKLKSFDMRRLLQGPGWPEQDINTQQG